jgi:hypothetical protein
MPVGEKPRFDLIIGSILCHDNPVLAVSNALPGAFHTEVTIERELKNVKRRLFRRL